MVRRVGVSPRVNSSGGGGGGDDMSTITKSAVQHLKTLEMLVREPVPNRDEFLRCAKEVAIAIHGLMRLSQVPSASVVFPFSEAVDTHALIDSLFHSFTHSHTCTRQNSFIGGL
jgi:hypothetical protein